MIKLRIELKFILHCKNDLELKRVYRLRVIDHDD